MHFCKKQKGRLIRFLKCWRIILSKRGENYTPPNGGEENEPYWVLYLKEAICSKPILILQKSAQKDKIHLRKFAGTNVFGSFVKIIGSRYGDVCLREILRIVDL
jgi:hypothetical protein